MDGNIYEIKIVYNKNLINNPLGKNMKYNKETRTGSWRIYNFYFMHLFYKSSKPFKEKNNLYSMWMDILSRI